MHMLGGSICGQFEFPGSYSNAVFWPYSGTVESPYAKSLPSTFTLTGLVKTVDGQQHPAISIYTVGATISAGNSGSSAISATFQYDPGPLIVVG
jgi:hypothetical protein